MPSEIELFQGDFEFFKLIEFFRIIRIFKKFKYSLQKIQNCDFLILKMRIWIFLKIFWMFGILKKFKKYLVLEMLVKIQD